MLKALQPIYTLRDPDGTLRDHRRPLDEIASWEVNQIHQSIPVFFEQELDNDVVEEHDLTNLEDVIDHLNHNPDTHFSCNVRMDIFCPKSGPKILSLLQQNRDCLGRLTLEVVEHGYIRCQQNGRYAHEKLMANLETARQLGAKLSIDDYGTGHNGMSLLLQNVWSQVKIDGLIVEAATERGSRGYRLLESLTKDCQDLGVAVVFERIENPQMLRLAYEIGADAVQGYYCQRPILCTVEDFPTARFEMTSRGGNGFREAS